LGVFLFESDAKIAADTPAKSFSIRLILALVIISRPLSTPPINKPMMTSTIAISTRVKPD